MDERKHEPACTLNLGYRYCDCGLLDASLKSTQAVSNDAAAPQPVGTREAPYFVEVDDNGCATCGHDRTYTVVGPDGVALITSWTDADEAEWMAEQLNTAAALYAAPATPPARVERCPYCHGTMSRFHAEAGQEYAGREYLKCGTCCRACWADEFAAPATPERDAPITKAMELAGIRALCATEDETGGTQVHAIYRAMRAALAADPQQEPKP